MSLRDRPEQGSQHRRVRLRAGRQPDRHRHADVLELARHPRQPRPATATTRPRHSPAGGGRLPQGLRRHLRLARRARSCRSTSSTSAATPTGSPRMQAVAQQLPRRSASSSPPDNLSADDYDDTLFNGNFDLAYYAETGGPTPYYELRQWLYSANSAPIGQQAASNFERYSDPETDTLLNQYAATTDPAQQQQIIDQLQQVMLTQVPVIPVTEAVDWYQYDTAHFTGWATPQRPVRTAGRLPVSRTWARCCCTCSQVIDAPGHVRKEVRRVSTGARREVSAPPPGILRAHPVGRPDHQLPDAPADAGQPGHGDAGALPRPDHAGRRCKALEASPSASTRTRACLAVLPLHAATRSPGTSGPRCSTTPEPVTSVLAQAMPVDARRWSASPPSWPSSSAPGSASIAAWRRGSRLDSILPPVFVVDLGAPLLLGRHDGRPDLRRDRLNWLPTAHSAPTRPSTVALQLGRSSATCCNTRSCPAAAVLITSIGAWVLTMRNTMVTTLAEDYIRMARAKGLPNRRIMFDYAARNAILPNLTGFAMSLGSWSAARSWSRTSSTTPASASCCCRRCRTRTSR